MMAPTLLLNTYNDSESLVKIIFSLVSYCHLVPPQDTKLHKVSLSGEDTKWHNVCHLVSFVLFVTMATKKIV